jgi:hypothetical protein
MRVGRGACDHEVDPDSFQFTAFSLQPAMASCFQLLQARRHAAPACFRARLRSSREGAQNGCARGLVFDPRSRPPFREGGRGAKRRCGWAGEPATTKLMHTFGVRSKI